MPSSTLLSEAVAALFEAKKIQLQEMPECRLLDVGPLKCIHNHPNWPEVDGFYALDAPPTEVVAAVQSYGPDAKHMITALGPSPDSLQDTYLELGYRLLPWAEPFMIKLLSTPLTVNEKVIVQVRETPTLRDYWIEEDGLRFRNGNSA